MSLQKLPFIAGAITFVVVFIMLQMECGIVPG